MELLDIFRPAYYKEQRAEDKKEIPTHGSIRKPKGVDMWFYNIRTGELGIVDLGKGKMKPDVIYGLVFPTYGDIIYNAHYKMRWNPDCNYAFCINRKNAVRKLKDRWKKMNKIG
ncbi:MAG: hypothetical protein F6K19_01635 [Cyanothece sp. SIO1E1]|nr:hypothetical protein [Cyanothece sp. SIO1E1]